MVVTAPLIGVAVKWAPLHVAVDPLTGTPALDAVAYGISAADRTAVEIGLRLAERFDGALRAATVGPRAAEEALREACAMGAAEAVHVLVEDASLPPGSPASCARTAAGLAAAFRGCAFVVCGDYSVDGGTGAVPGLLAATVGAAQALGLTRVEPVGPASSVEGERRLDRGRRELVRVTAPAVLSVEPSAAQPRRASLPLLLQARSRSVRVECLPDRDEAVQPASYAPFRPRTRVAAPPGALPPDGRIRAILGIGAEQAPARVLRAEPDEAARAILDQLRDWGYA